MMWTLNPGTHFNDLGLIPYMLDEDDPASAREQFDAKYQHGGGWRPFKGFTMLPDRTLTYPEDPPNKPRAITMLREEMIIFYDFAWVAIVQPDGTWEVARMD